MPSQISGHFLVIQSSIGEKFSTIIYSLATVLSGIIIAFVLGPLFALVTLAFIPVIFLIVMGLGGVIKKATIAKITVSK